MSTIEEKIAVMQAFANGAKVEWSYGGKWLETNDPCWNWGSCEYRVKEGVKDEIDWDQVSDKLICSFRLLTGTCVLSTKVPELGQSKTGGYWKNLGFCVDAAAFKSYKQGDLPWHQSLVLRPQK